MFVLLWRGWGFLVIVFVVASLIATVFLVDNVFGHGTFTARSVWPGLAIGVGGLMSVVMGRRLNGDPVPYLARDVVEGQPFRPRVPFFFARHNLIFIPMEAWGILLILFGAYTAIRSVT